MISSSRNMSTYSLCSAYCKQKCSANAYCIPAACLSVWQAPAGVHDQQQAQRVGIPLVRRPVQGRAAIHVRLVDVRIPAQRHMVDECRLPILCSYMAHL